MTAYKFEAQEALPFIMWRDVVTSADVAERFGLTFQNARAVIRRLKKKDQIHTVTRGGNTKLSTYRYGPEPRPDRPEWVPQRDMTSFLVSMTPGHRA